ncbi:MAG: hypothetical protein AVDCRST_MAG19-3500, partial [uncultured Thermomicrobiales bacterium]
VRDVLRGLEPTESSREPPAGRRADRGRGAHLRKQVQGSVAHGTGGVGLSSRRRLTAIGCRRRRRTGRAEM